MKYRPGRILVRTTLWNPSKRPQNMSQGLFTEKNHRTTYFPCVFVIFQELQVPACQEVTWSLGRWGLQVDFYSYTGKDDITEKKGNCFFSFWFCSIFAVRILNNGCLYWGHQLLYCAHLLNTKSCLETIYYTMSKHPYCSSLDTQK